MKNFLFPFLMVLCVAFVSCGKEKSKEKKTAQATLEQPAILKSEDDMVRFDLKTSSIKWEGAALTKTHDGFLMFDEAVVYVDQNEGLYGGKFIVNMKSLTVEDLTGEDKLSLEGHLKGTLEGKEDHFFDVNQYPTSTLEIVHADRVNEYVYNVISNLTIKDQTVQIQFSAKLAYNESSNVYNFITERITVDRTKFGIKFMSSNFFDSLGDKAINDEIILNVNLLSEGRI